MMHGMRRRILFLVLALLVCGTTSVWGDPGTASTRTPIHFTLPDHRGHDVSLSDFKDSRLVVVAFLGTECPLAKLYAVRLEQLARAYSSDQVAVIAIDSNLQDRLTEMGAFAKRHGLSYPFLKDKGSQVADLLGAERTPQVFLLDELRTVRYQGRIDDQYVVGIQRTQPEREDLKEAIQELLDGRPVQVAKTTPLGCLIGRPKTPNASSPVTYSREISRIFQKHCVECHRPGEIGPFPMQTYDDVAGWGEMIAEVVSEKRMPPWHADPHVGTFANDTSLSAEDREQIAVWVKNGCPEGNPADLPEPVHYVDGWQFDKEPDLVIAMADQPFKVPAEATDGIKYQQFWVPTHLTEDKWITGMEIRPGNREVVHHVIVYSHPAGRKSKSHEFVTAYVPGLRGSPLPPGSAKKLKAGSWLRFEVHYTPNGTAQDDLTRVGFLFADPNDVTLEVKTTVAGSQDFEIKPFLDNQTFVARSAKSPATVQLISMSPHMHLRGKGFEYVAEYPDGTEEVLLKVPHYDFNWQTRYSLAEPKTIPKGTVIRCTATFDNSAKNLANPDPSATVVWGDQSWEEMLLGYMDIMFPAALSGGKGQLKGAGIPAGVDGPTIRRLADTDKDGRLSKDEARQLPLLESNFDDVDQNRDGFISDQELQEALDYYRKRL